MSVTVLDRPPELPTWLNRRGPWFLAILVTAVALVSVIGAIGNLENSFPAPPPRSQSPLLALPAALALWLLQMRHSTACAQGVRPRGWPVSLLALAVLGTLPFAWFSVNWISAAWFPVASAAMVLRGRAAARLIVIATVAVGVAAGWATVLWGSGRPFDVAFYVFYNGSFYGFGVLALYWSALLVDRIGALVETRAELARSTVVNERRRLSRDMHDVMGHALSAIALKGDLARRLAEDRPELAIGELEDITDTARQARLSIEEIARAEHEISWEQEVDRGVALLEAGNIDVRLVDELPALPAPVSALFGWTVREAVTNILRHSHAQRCWVRATAQDGHVHVEIVNNGAGRRPSGSNVQGQGLRGLAERARELGGRLEAGRDKGVFRLRVEVPA